LGVAVLEVRGGGIDDQQFLGIGRAPYEETRPTSRTSRGRAPDISKSQQSIGYQPVLDVAELLERVIAYEREGGIGPDGRVAG
jgi:hypothetical protein